MKKIIIISIIFIIIIFVNITFKTTIINASNDEILSMENITLFKENIKLKNDLETLLQRIQLLEQQTEEIKNYDLSLYSQIMGIDIDTISFSEYNHDTISRHSLTKYDSIFNVVDQKTRLISRILSKQYKKLKITSKYLEKNKDLLELTPTISPIQTKDLISISSPFGWRLHPIYKKYLFHDGIDISAYHGTSVYSTAKGRVKKILYSKYGYGNRIVIENELGFEILYAHLDKIKVKKGEKINKNQIIGTVGNTGTSTGPHLHYEIRENNKLKNPLGYFHSYYIDENLIASK